MIKKKLSSSRGATLIFALVALALAVIVCAVVIYAAQNTAGRIRSAQAAEQAQLTLSSAASVVRDELADLDFTVIKSETTKTTTRNKMVVKTEKEAQPMRYGDKTPDDLTVFEKQLEQWLEAVVNDEFTEDITGTYHMKAAELEDVNVTFRMESLPAEEGDASARYDLFVTLQLDPDNIKDARQHKYPRSVELSWTNIISVKEESQKPSQETYTEDDNGEPVTITVETRETTTTGRLALEKMTVAIKGADLK